MNNNSGNEYSLSNIDTNIQYWPNTDEDYIRSEYDTNKSGKQTLNELRLMYQNDIQYSNNSQVYLQNKENLSQHGIGGIDYIPSSYNPYGNNDYARPSYFRSGYQGISRYSYHPYLSNRNGYYPNSSNPKIWCKSARSYWDEEKTYTLNVETGNFTVSRRLGKKKLI
ncbi:hypothetical protein AYI69_g1088 [Smittium culicis]|uniref:Uncharacterized protein n=1 Tax=Smittium culicis TaxID=133412 RepID=A0A1R1YR89_9FUNG|nr:hypothetical protein AYI69_g1088 [Smittium culicis]